MSERANQPRLSQPIDKLAIAKVANSMTQLGIINVLQSQRTVEKPILNLCVLRIALKLLAVTLAP